MNLVFKITAAATPLGSTLLTLTKDDLEAGSGFRVELAGLGAGRIVINRNRPEATAANFAQDNYVRVYDLDISAVIPLGGFFLDDTQIQVLSLDEEGGEIVQFGGPGALSYFGRCTLDKVNYVHFGDDAHYGPRVDGSWYWYNDQYGDILKRMIDEAQDADRPAEGHGIDDLTYDFGSSTDSAGDAWDTFSGNYSLPIGTNYLDIAQRLRDVGLTIQVSGDLLMQAFQGFWGVDRTTASFADGKVRFVNVDGAAGANIVEELPRQSHPSLQLSRVLVQGDSGDPATMVTRDAASYNVAREGFAQYPSSHALATLQAVGDQALQIRSDSSDVPSFRHIPGANGSSGRYAPFPPTDAEVDCFDLDPATLLPQPTVNGDAEDTGGGQWSGGAYQTTWRHAGARSYGVGSSTTPNIVYTFDPTQVFEGGQRYTIDIWNHQGGNHVSGTVSLGVAGGDEVVLDVNSVPILDNLGGYTEVGVDGFNWAHRRICWTPSADRTGVRFRWQEVQTTGTGLEFVLDDLAMWTADSTGSHYWLGDLVTLHTGTETGDYTETNLRVYAVNWELDDDEWWPRPEIGGLLQLATQTIQTPGVAGVAGSGSGGVVTVTSTPAPPTTVERELTNKSGGAVARGDVVVIDPDNDEAFETTTTAAETREIGIAQEDIASNAKGRVATHGYVELVNVDASVTRSHYGFTSTTVKTASGAVARAAGAFCQFLKGGTGPSAILFGPPDAASSGGSSILDDLHGRFLAAYHRDSDESAHLLVSDDGVTWTSLVSDLLNSSHIIRDTSIIHWDGAYWMVATYSGSTNFRIYKSLDLSAPWSEVVTYTDAGNTNTWAPEWIRNLDGTPYLHPSTGFPCIMFARSTDSTSTFVIREVHPTNRGMTAVSSAVTVTGTSLPTKMIDPFCLTDGTTFYLWYKDESTKRIEYATGTALTSGYEVSQSGDWAGWYAAKAGGVTSIEGPCVIRLPDGRWRIYFNENNGFNSVRTVYSDSTDTSGSGPGGAWGSWTAQASITTPDLMGHGSVIYLPGIYDHERDPFAHPDIGGALVLDDLTDVALTSPAADDALVFDGANWVNAAPVPATHWEVLMTDAITNPPDPLLNEDGTDWLYGEVT